MLNQKQLVQFSSEDNKIKILCETDTPLGEIHDYLMHVKGYIVDRMVAAQKEEEAVSEAHKNTTCGDE